MLRVLHIFHNMGNGGIEHFVMDYYRHIDRSKVQFDFLTSVDESGYFDNEILSLGGKIYHAYPLKKNPIKNYYDIARIVRENSYNIVHRHTGSAFGYFDLRAARLGGATKLILHAHNPQVGKPMVHALSNALLKFDCIKFACSKAAGDFLFGENADYKIIKNTIDCEKFCYSKEKRDAVRDELRIPSDCKVIGHIGRFEDQKNHKKLIDIFAAVCKKRINCALVCVGDGRLMHDCKKYAEGKGIASAIFFLGVRDDVDQLMNGFDIFCFPSKYEGFGITLIEAQANGLQCVTSQNVVPLESNISGNVEYVSLQSDAEVWAEKLLSLPVDRDLTAVDAIRAAGYDLKTEAKILTECYLQMMN